MVDYVVITIPFQQNENSANLSSRFTAYTKRNSNPANTSGSFAVRAYGSNAKVSNLGRTVVSSVCHTVFASL